LQYKRADQPHAGCVIVLAKSRTLELEDNILRTFCIPCGAVKITSSPWTVTLSWQNRFITYEPSKLGQVDLSLWFVIGVHNSRSV